MHSEHEPAADGAEIPLPNGFVRALTLGDVQAVSQWLHAWRGEGPEWMLDKWSTRKGDYVQPAKLALRHGQFEVLSFLHQIAHPNPIPFDDLWSTFDGFNKKVAWSKQTPFLEKCLKHWLPKHYHDDPERCHQILDWFLKLQLPVRHDGCIKIWSGLQAPANMWWDSENLRFPSDEHLLVRAVKHECWPIAQWSISHPQFNPNWKNHLGQPLLYALVKNMQLHEESSMNHFWDIVANLIKKGADPELKDFGGRNVWSLLDKLKESLLGSSGPCYQAFEDRLKSYVEQRSLSSLYVQENLSQVSSQKPLKWRL